MLSFFKFLQSASGTFYLLQKCILRMREGFENAIRTYSYISENVLLRFNAVFYVSMFALKTCFEINIIFLMLLPLF